MSQQKPPALIINILNSYLNRSNYAIADRKFELNNLRDRAIQAIEQYKRYKKEIAEYDKERMEATQWIEQIES